MLAPFCLVVFTDSYHLHVTTFEVAMETPGGGDSLSFEVGITTAIAVVGDIIKGSLLFGIHDCSLRRCDVKEQGREGEGGGGE